MKKLPSLQSIIEKSAIQSWSWYHFIFLYAITPFIVLTISLINFNDLFILDICHPTIISIYMTNFEHITLPHLSGNLITYLFAITGIFFLEKDKTRFRNMLVFLFIILPIIGSTLYIQYFGNICSVREFSNAYGFSMITLGFTGYFVYQFLLASIPQFFKIIEENYYKSTMNYIFSIQFAIFVNFIIVIMIDFFGIVSGMFSVASSIGLNNGFVHSVGFVTGVFLPMVMELKKENKLDYFHKTLLIHFEALIIFLTTYFTFFYYTWIV